MVRHILPRRVHYWRKRSLMVWRLRLRNRIVMIRRGFLRLYAIQCSEEELDELLSINEARVGLLGAYVQYLVGVSAKVPPIRVICLGRNAKAWSIPRAIISQLDRAHGCWLDKLRIAFVCWHEDPHIQRTVFHEAAHLLFYVLTSRLLYPRGFSDAYATWCELLADGSLEHVRTVHPGKGPGGSLAPDEIVTIRELVAFTSANITTHTMATYWRVMTSGLWLFMYLRYLDPINPIPDRLLFELRINDIRTPDGVIKWLENASGQGITELEEGFRFFCTKGHGN
jgi:hypothetical protein